MKTRTNSQNAATTAERMRRNAERERERANHKPRAVFIVGGKLGESLEAQRARLQKEER